MAVENRLRKEMVTAPDWPKMLDQLSEVMPTKHIARAMGLTVLTESMLRSYRSGVQPMYWRGEALVTFWCETFSKSREEVPIAPIVRGHRAQRRLVDTSPRVMALPNWAAVVPTASNGITGKRKRQKVAA